MSFFLLHPLPDFTEEQAKGILSEAWRGYDWETVVARSNAKTREREAAQTVRDTSVAMLEIAL